MPQAAKNELLRMLPQVEEVLASPEILKLKEELPHSVVVGLVREAIQEARQAVLDSRILQGDSDPAIQQLSCGAVALKARQKACTLQTPSLRKVVNVSGIVLHTNLGRSVFSDAAAQAVQEVVANYSSLEYDPASQARGSRHGHYEQLVCALTGAQAALAVNNNAAAVLMVLSEFASGHEAVVSRGELVEIGGSFRVPDIMRLSHAEMREVGTTNKTRLSDYEQAITPRTALLLKVHPSNYRMVGFTESVDVAALRTLADAINEHRAAGANAAATPAAGAEEAGAGGPSQPPQAPQPPRLLVYEDQGSGALFPLDCFGGPGEPSVAESLKNGCDLVSFSGDKLLGGPQAGIIVGDREHIGALKRSPLARALRLDKMAVAALEATLRLYLDKGRALHEIPTLRMLSMSADEACERARQLQQAIESALQKGMVDLDIVEEAALAGGGSLPMSSIPSCALRIGFKQGDAQGCSSYLSARHPVPIVARIKKEALLCDGRTLLDRKDMEEIARALKGYFESLEAPRQEG
ncbi:MAG: L-seryl-tRNA(Sec) selenium transferase [Eggerthellaceae bacterium]|nr:L-seryl-tRNA(Sec) selenium transferase [Eggerthellaceae bacterium]